MIWQDFFKIVWHPDPGYYIIHWLSNNRPVNSDYWHYKENAESWIKANHELIISECFEKEFLK